MNSIKRCPVHFGTFAILLFVSTALLGCAYAVRPYNEPSLQKLQLHSAAPDKYTVRVADKLDYSVPADGRVIVEVPRLERGCATYLFGVVKIKDSSPYDVAAIHVKKDGRAIRRLSLNDLAKLSSDNDGYRVVKLE